MAKTKLQKAQLFDIYTKILEQGDFILLKLSPYLPAKAINAYRQYLEDNNGRMHLLKNKVFLKAVETKDSYKEHVNPESITGNIALITGEDIIATLKGLEQLEQSAKELLGLAGKDEVFVKKYQAFEYMFGYVQGAYVEAADIKMLSELPGVNALYGMLAGGLNGLLSGFVSVLGGNIRNLAYALKQVSENKKE